MTLSIPFFVLAALAALGPMIAAIILAVQLDRRRRQPPPDFRPGPPPGTVR